MAQSAKPTLTTRIAAVQNAGTPKERVLSPDTGVREACERPK